jgi:hypothetical protein
MNWSIAAAGVRGWSVAGVLALSLIGSASVAHAAGGSGPAPSATISDDARQKFNVGVNLLTDPEGPRYEEAYRAFKQAYAASPVYKILGNLGLCAMKLERDDEAIAAYEKYLADGGKDLSRSEVKQITDDLATLKAAVAHVTIESDPPGAEIFDARIPVRGERVLNDYGAIAQPTKLGLHQGTHQLTARLAGYPDQTWDVEIVGGQDPPPHKFVFSKEAPPPVQQAVVPVAPTAPPPPVTSRPVPTSVWIGVAATGALAAATVVTSVLAMSNHNDFENARTAGDVSKQNSLKDSGQTKNIIADACLGGAAVAFVVTGVLFFTRPSVNMESGHAKNTLVIAPEVGRSSAGLGIQGSF